MYFSGKVAAEIPLCNDPNIVVILDEVFKSFLYDLTKLKIYSEMKAV